AMRNRAQGYVRGGIYAMPTLVVLTFRHFRRVKPTWLALLPLGVAALWMVPCMALLDVPMNIANLIVIPLFMGMSIDNGIHLVDRALEPPRTATQRPTQSTGRAVVLATLTTIVGFG